MERVRLSKCICGSTKRPVLSYFTDELYGIAYAAEVYCTVCEKATAACPDGYSAADAWNRITKEAKTKEKVWLTNIQ